MRDGTVAEIRQTVGIFVQINEEWPRQIVITSVPHDDVRAEQIIEIYAALAAEDVSIKIEPTLAAIVGVALPPHAGHWLLAIRILMRLADVHEFVRRHPGG